MESQRHRKRREEEDPRFPLVMVDKQLRLVEGKEEQEGHSAKLLEPTFPSVHRLGLCEAADEEFVEADLLLVRVLERNKLLSS